jgi:EAL domain-containing protein (putative c-di-GMP-specific phosphodiesterase class I)
VHWFALADEFALRDRLELACLREGLKLLGDLPAGARLSVNLSGPLLLDPRTSELLRGTPHLDRLILEVTENSLLEDTPGVAAEIARLIGEGLNFAVDDMGAGYSGLRQVTTVPSHLPQARPLADQRHRRGSRPWRAGHGDARLRPPDRWSSDRRGRGDRGELDTLRQLGVTLIQGYLLGRPAAPWPSVDLPAPAPAISLHRVQA